MTRGSYAPFLASLYALSILKMSVWALTLCMVILCSEFLIMSTTRAIKNLSWWLLWERGSRCE